MRRLALAATLVVAFLALSGSSASANGACYVQEKTPSGFKLKCDKQLHDGAPYPAIRLWSSDSTSLTAVSISAPAGVTCVKNTTWNPPTVFFDCNGPIAPDTEILGSVSATGGASICDISLYLAATYNGEFGDGNYSLGSFKPCSDEPPDAHATHAQVKCLPGSVLVFQASTCTVTVFDDAGSGPSTPTKSIAWTAPDSTGTFPKGAACTLAPVPGSTTKAACSVKFLPHSVAPELQTVKASYAGDTSHDSTAAQTQVKVGKRPVDVDLTCKPKKPRVGKTTKCTALLTDIGAGTKSAPTGSVKLRSDSDKGTFPDGKKCTLEKLNASQARCVVAYKPGAKGKQTLTATYAGDATHLGRTGELELTVRKKKPKS